MSDRATKNKGLGNRTIPQRNRLDDKPTVLTQIVGTRWILFFDRYLFADNVVAYLFRSGNLPADFSVTPIRDDGNPTLFRPFSEKWLITWKGSMRDRLNALSPLGEQLYLRAISGGDEFPEDTKVRREAEALETRQNHERNQTFLAALDMTADEALRTLKPGNYVAAPRKPLVALAPLQTDDVYPPNVSWMTNYKNGYFVQMLTGEMRMVPISSNPQFWKDMTWWLKGGSEIFEANKRFGKDWDKLFFTMIAGYALAMTNAPSIGGRADLAETALSQAAREAQRMIGREVRPPKSFSGAFSKIDMIEAAQVGVAGAGVLMQDIQIIEDLRRKQSSELQSVGQSVTQALADRISGLPREQIIGDLRPGQLGEAIVKKTLELRGYVVIELQNASGQGIDLLAVKPKSNLIVYLEVKTSIGTDRGRLSLAQKNPQEFVVDRLKRIIEHAGLYKNVSDAQIEIAKMCLKEIENGRPIGGIRVNVLDVAKGPGMISLEFEFWKPTIPRATVAKEPATLVEGVKEAPVRTKR